MSNRQVQVINIVNISCNQATHQGRVIQALCLNPKCQENASLCSNCLSNNHKQCRDQLNELQAVSMQLKDIQQLQQDIVGFQEKINQQFKELTGQIDQIQLQISNYKDIPNLGNLNEIGTLLRNNIKQTLLQSFDRTINQIRLLLDNQRPNLEIKQKQEKKQELNQQQEQLKDQTKTQFLKGHSLYQQKKYFEAINCFDMTIQFNPKNIDAWFYKGRSLQLQNKYLEAISCYDKAIKIYPKHFDSWYWKGQSLEYLDRLEESIKCFEKCEKFNPGFTNDDLKRINDKLKQKSKLNEF